MSKTLQHTSPLLLLLLSATAASTQSVVPRRTPSDNAVAQNAWRIVSGIHGTWTQMPGEIATGRMTGGALIGNGSVGVAIGGTPDKQQYYIGRDDFWSVQRGKIMPVGQLQLSLPALANATANLQENIASGDVSASFAAESAHVNTRAWVDADKNFFYVELENTGASPMDTGLRMLDGFGKDDRENLGGATGQVFWRRVSPEVVHATVGGPNDGKGAFLDADVRSLQIFDTSQTAGVDRSKPVYAWKGASDLWTSRGGSSAQPFSCGNIILPEKQFTVRATLRADHAPSGVVFSSVSQHWRMQQQDPTNPLGNVRGHDIGRPQGAEAGLSIYFTEGRLAANLNGTVLTADLPLPLQQWAEIAVSYDGRVLTLLVNGKPVGHTRDFPTPAQVLGPEWMWAASHPGDPRLPFAGMAPAGVMATRVVGARASEKEGELSFRIPAQGKVIVAIAVTDDRDSPSYFQQALSTLNRSDAGTITAARTRQKAWWHQFWSRSYVEFPDKTVQAWWYGSLYVLASCSRHGNVAPGLWGNWITSSNVGWQGDYTLDYNYQAPFWAAFPTNHVDLADPYDAPLLDWLGRGKALADTLHAHGLVYYTHLSPSPGWSSDNFRTLDQKSDALFAAVNCIQRWRYTRDVNYARKMWPLLTGVAEFWDHDLELENGRYVDLDDAEDEHLWGPAHDKNPATVIGFLRMLYPALLDMSQQLGVGQGQRAAWQDKLARLSSLPLAPAASVPAIASAVGTTIPADQMVIVESEEGMRWVDISKGDRFAQNPPVVMTGSSAGMNSLQVVFPAWNVGLESSQELRDAALHTVDYTRLWYDNNNTSNFYAAAAGAGYDPASILQHLHLLVTHIGYPSFAYRFPAGGIENEATVPTAITSMLLQSYQENIHVFPDWPADQDASFGNLLAVGNFLVSSSMKNGRAESVALTSLRGGVCRLANPWKEGQAVRLQISGASSQVLHGANLVVATHAGQKLVFTPAEDAAR